MWDVDQLILGRTSGASLAIVLFVAAVLGLRHASDPDHLVAVSTLVATEPDQPTRRAGLLGVAWGYGHATTLTAFGLPIVLLGASLPPALNRAAETLVGVVIVALALRLLSRWRAGRFHVHEHAHGPRLHRHLHAHGETSRVHGHPIRSPLQAYGIGLIHGAGGSAAVTLLLLAAIPDTRTAAAALLMFAFGTALSMALLSCGFGYALSRPLVLRRFGRLAPALALLSLMFGVWCAVGAAI
jgi:sulfite exporter TauE/SafE